MSAQPLYALLKRLEEDQVHFNLNRYRDDSVTVTATYLNERVEIDVFEDGHMEVSRFQGSEDILGDAKYVYELLDQKNDEEKKASSLLKQDS